MVDNETDNNPGARPDDETRVNEEPKENTDQESRETDQRTPAEKKRDKAVKISREIKEQREKREQLERLIAATTDKKGKKVLSEQLDDLDKDVSKLVGQARGTLSPDLERLIQKEEDRLAKLGRTGTEVDFNQEKNKAKRLEEEGRTQKEPITEVAGMVLELKVQELEQLAEHRATSKVEKMETTVSGTETWAEIQEKKAEIYIDPYDRVEATSASAEMARLVAQEDQLVRQALETDPQLQKDQEEINELRDQSRNPDQAGEVLARLEEMIADATEQEERDEILNQPDAGLRLSYLNRQREKIIGESISRAPVFRQFAEAMNQVEKDRNGLMTRYDKGEINAEELEHGGRRLKEQRGEAERALVQQLSGDRGKLYEPLPPKRSSESQEDYEDRLDTWVWKKISAIDNASISPSALVYSPAYTSLLYALTESALPDRLKNNINAWRGAYEVALIWDASGRPEDVLARAADMDPDTFGGLIGQYQRDGKGNVMYEKNPDGTIKYKKLADGRITTDPDGNPIKIPIYTEQGKKIQEAFAKLDERGYEMTHGSTAESRRAIHAEIAKLLNQGELKDRQFGVVYERIAYRFWKILGREGRFDRVVIAADQDMKVKKDEKVFVYREVVGIDGKKKTVRLEIPRDGEIKKGDLVSISETGDEIAARRKTDRRYNNAFSKTSIKFWYRRLVGDKMVGGLRQEKNIKFIPELFDHISYGIKDYISDSMGLKGKKGDDGSVEKIDESALQNLDWENRTGTYGVWIDDLRKAAETRKELIRPDGVLDRPLPINDPRVMAKLKEVFETFADKSNTAFKEYTKGMIELHRRKMIPRIVVEDVLNPGDDPEHPTGKHLRIISSEGQRRTGMDIDSWGRSGIENYIDSMVRSGMLSYLAGEELKRETLGFMGLPGVLPVRLAGRVVEGVPGTMFGFFFGILSKLFEITIGEVAGGGAPSGGKRR